MRVKAWRDSMKRWEREINGDTPITDSAYLPVDPHRANLRVVGVTTRQYGASAIIVRFEKDGLDGQEHTIPAYGELMDAKIGDRLRIVFAEDADEWEGTE